MTERVRKLREASCTTQPYISAERALLVTEAYRTMGFHSAPVLRALVFKHVLEHKTICINPGELIVGERGPAPRATPTYPEICCHSLEDLTILDTRPKIPYAVSDEVRKQYAETVIPFWKGRTIREKIFAEMTPSWHDAFAAGIFTEFMEQRAPGHTVLDDKIYHRGMLDFIREIDLQLEHLDYYKDPLAYGKQEELRGMRIAAEAMIRFAERHAQALEREASQCTNPHRHGELTHLAALCRRVPAHAPQTFHEALQAYWFVHIGVVTELNPWDSFNPGRLDQHLLPFYQAETTQGTLTEEHARELLECLWVKFNNQPAPPKVGVTAAESATYTDFANINSGGMRPDGSDGVNAVTYLVLDVVDEMRLVQPSSNIQLSRKNPDAFLKHALRIVRKGWGQPSIFNADTVVEEMLRQGKSIEDARCGGTSGCVETGAFGKESYILTGYLNFPKILEVTLHNGVDPRSGKSVGLRTGDPRSFRSFGELLKAYRTQLRHFVDIKIRGNNVIERIYAHYVPTPFLSVLIDDCIRNGKDYADGGARYNTNYIQGVGIGTLADCFSAVNTHVFETHAVDMDELMRTMAQDFEGSERLRQLILNRTPRYGNDDDRADDLMREGFEMFHEAVNGRPNTKQGVYRIQMLPTTCHVYFGSVTGATPDGRLSGMPVSEGISPVQGADRTGPTAVLRSAAKMDHARTGGTLLNQKFTPDLLAGEEGIEDLTRLVRSYFTMGGHHIQFNVVDAATLRAAQQHPEQHRDLIVRVAGYSDYFCDLGKTLQDEIISRTEHHSW
ncbi:MAG TPA: trans-4-hydroxy-L-proline dehydratase [Bacteroidota bacterium]|nr:trans-4-hydroxy-L-proline dehydratase [Bacteroidota bacterium]